MHLGHNRYTIIAVYIICVSVSSALPVILTNKKYFDSHVMTVILIVFKNISRFVYVVYPFKMYIITKRLLFPRTSMINLIIVYVVQYLFTRNTKY
jgi:hypothetical protein